MNDEKFVVALQQNRHIIIPSKWIQNPKVGNVSKIFYSPKPDDVADFSLETKYFFNAASSGCYNGRVVKYGEVGLMENFAEWKRPQYNRFSTFKFDTETLVDEICVVSLNIIFLFSSYLQFCLTLDFFWNYIVG